MKRESAWAICFLLFLLCGCDLGPSVEEQIQKGEGLYNGKQFAAARKVFESALKNSSKKDDRAVLHTLVGSCEMELENHEEALAQFAKALELRPDYAPALNNSGISYRSLGDVAKARESYQKAIKADPKYPFAHSSLGTLLLLEGEYPESIDHFERALKLDNSIAVTHGNLALAYAKVGRFADADASLKASIERGYVNAEIIREQIEELRAEASKATP